MPIEPEEPRVLLLGTAHVVDLSGPLRRVFSGRVLDGVAVELDYERAHALLTDPKGPRPTGNAPLLARLWAHLQRRLGAEIGGGDPGEEMKLAATLARERGLPLFLIDDPIRVTFARLLRSMPVRERVTLLLGGLVGLFVPARVVSEEMDRYADRPEEFTEELRRASPTVARVLLDERNEHMADRLAHLRAQGFGRLAVVVGDAHVPGLFAALGRRGVPVEAIPFRELRALRGPSSSPA